MTPVLAFFPFIIFMFTYMCTHCMCHLLLLSPFFFFFKSYFLVVLGSELRVLHLLGKLSVIWAIPQALFSSILPNKFSHFSTTSSSTVSVSLKKPTSTWHLCLQYVSN
jgi:hypothetical protein